MSSIALSFSLAKEIGLPPMPRWGCESTLALVNIAYNLLDDATFRELAALADAGAVEEWHAGPPCWSFGTLRRPRLHSKLRPAGYNMADLCTREQTVLAVRTAFVMILAVRSGCLISVEQPGSSVMFFLTRCYYLWGAG